MPLFPVNRCTADCGWITGHSYVTYGPLLNGATVVVYEGVINFNMKHTVIIYMHCGARGNESTRHVISSTGKKFDNKFLFLEFKNFVRKKNVLYQ